MLESAEKLMKQIKDRADEARTALTLDNSKTDEIATAHEASKSAVEKARELAKQIAAAVEKNDIAAIDAIKLPEA